MNVLQSGQVFDVAEETYAVVLVFSWEYAEYQWEHKTVDYGVDGVQLVEQ